MAAAESCHRRPRPAPGLHWAWSDFPGHVQAARCPRLPSLSPPRALHLHLRGAAASPSPWCACAPLRPHPPLCPQGSSGFPPRCLCTQRYRGWGLTGPLDCSKGEKKNILAQPFSSILQGGGATKSPAWKSSGRAVTGFLSFLGGLRPGVGAVPRPRRQLVGRRARGTEGSGAASAGLLALSWPRHPSPEHPHESACVSLGVSLALEREAWLKWWLCASL